MELAYPPDSDFLGCYGNRRPRDKANDSSYRRIESVLVQLGW